MTNLTYGVQLRKATVTDFVAKYKIDMHITDRGPLPDQHVFLKTIVDDSDPKQDTLKRVCRVGDLLSFPKSREEALRKRTGMWRDSGLTRLYEDISQARVAADFLKERVNALVSSFTDYTDNFVADPGEQLIFPQTGIGVLTPLIEDYRAKKEERKEKEQELADKEASCAVTDATYNSVLTELSRTREALEALQTGKAALSVAYGTMVTQQQSAIAITTPISGTLSAWESVSGSAGTAVSDAMAPFLEDPTGTLYDTFTNDFQPQLTVYSQATAALGAQLADIEASVANMEAALQQLITQRDALLTAKETCAGEIAALTAAVQELEQQEETLLDRVQELCPEFTGD